MEDIMEELEDQKSEKTIIDMSEIEFDFPMQEEYFTEEERRHAKEFTEKWNFLIHSTFLDTLLKNKSKIFIIASSITTALIGLLLIISLIMERHNNQLLLQFITIYNGTSIFFPFHFVYFPHFPLVVFVLLSVVLSIITLITDAIYLKTKKERHSHLSQIILIMAVIFLYINTYFWVALGEELKLIQSVDRRHYYYRNEHLTVEHYAQVQFGHYPSIYFGIFFAFISLFITLLNLVLHIIMSGSSSFDSIKWFWNSLLGKSKGGYQYAVNTFLWKTILKIRKRGESNFREIELREPSYSSLLEEIARKFAVQVDDIEMILKNANILISSDDDVRRLTSRDVVEFGLYDHVVISVKNEEDENYNNNNNNNHSNFHVADDY